MTTKTISKEQMALNEKMANAIRDFVVQHELGGDMRIYFNGKAYHFTSTTEYTVLEDIVGSRFYQFANDETVSMSFEGDFYYVMNYGWENKNWSKLEEKFRLLLDKFGYYAELGHAWNLSLYK